MPTSLFLFADGRAGLPPQSRPEPSGDIGQDLDVVLVVETERKRERDLVDLPECGVPV
jgi:hypothetical protein